VYVYESRSFGSASSPAHVVIANVKIIETMTMSVNFFIVLLPIMFIKSLSYKPEKSTVRTVV
jgi:hypothetical protein